MGRGSDPRTKRRIDASVDPPPDLLIEIGLTSDSLNKFPVFAQLGVPEIWRFSGGHLAIFTLDGTLWGWKDVPNRALGRTGPRMEFTAFCRESRPCTSCRA